jgi:aminoglycoside/choline kinase family phosphotransferase
MNETAQATLLNTHYQRLTGHAATSIVAIRSHASDRKIYRLSSSGHSAIGVINPHRAENDAFVEFARFFLAQGLPVPEIYTYSADQHLYLEQDLGDQTLFDYLAKQREQNSQDFPTSVETIYQQALEQLARFQIESADKFNFSGCYPEAELLPGTFAGDCASFATDLVARLSPNLDTSRLTTDFARLIAFLEQARSTFFVYRDFQSRNMMLLGEKLYFIDFQGGRRGPLQYDVVSLLYQASTRVPNDVRARLLQHYCHKAALLTPFSAEEFHRYLSGFVVARMLQVLGVYGRQGLGAGKSYFKQSIPAALATLHQELKNPSQVIELPALRTCVERLRDRL